MLTMPAAADGSNGIRWLQPCSRVIWSGDLLRDNAFVVTDDRVVGFAIRNPSVAGEPYCDTHAHLASTCS